MIDWNPWVVRLGCVLLLYLRVVTGVSPNCTVRAYTPPPGPLDEPNAYRGATYHPALDAVVFTPCRRANHGSKTYHRIDCGVSAVPRQYTHTLTPVPMDLAYIGGAYHVGMNRLYWAPYTQSTQPLWHYMNATGGLVEYSSTAEEGNGYWGAVYCPTAQDLYFMPYGAAEQPSGLWSFINSTGHLNNYTAGTGAVNLAYKGGALCPTQRRIIMGPAAQGNQPSWHTIDCATGTVGSYSSFPGVGNQAYNGAVYHPSTDRVYFAPRNQAQFVTWHYYDCAAGNAQSYPARATGIGGYSQGGLVENQIVFAPLSVAPLPLYDVIGVTGAASTYSNPFTGLINITAADYNGGATCNVNGEARFYLSPAEPSTPDWHYITCTEALTASPTIVPTVSPTVAPSSLPSRAPSKLPSAAPTRLPSKQPSVSPTKAPTKVPTKQPSVSPTKAPTKQPSATPSKLPTVNPTKQPSVNPSVTPTKQPSVTPTQGPTATPGVPTKAPITVAPSAAPTRQPSAAPTVTPVSPTKAPTTAPTVAPTSVIPSSAVPSMNPTMVPTSGITAICLQSAVNCNGTTNTVIADVVIDVLVLQPTSELIISANATVTVTTFVQFAGILTLDLGDGTTLEKGLNVISPLNYTSYSGSFSSVDALTSKSCDSISVQQVDYDQTGLSVAVVFDSSGCSSTNVGLIAGLVAGTVLLAAGAVFGIHRYRQHKKDIFTQTKSVEHMRKREDAAQRQYNAIQKEHGGGIEMAVVANGGIASPVPPAHASTPSRTATPSNPVSQIQSVNSSSGNIRPIRPSRY